MHTIHDSQSTHQTETCACVLCGARLADQWAFALHRPWKNRYQRDKCRWPRELYQSNGVWTARPSIVDAVRAAEEGAADDWQIRRNTDATPRPATLALPQGRSRPIRTVSKNTPSNGAGSRGAYAAFGADQR
jgi:hypothetical protein